MYIRHSCNTPCYFFSFLFLFLLLHPYAEVHGVHITATLEQPLKVLEHARVCRDARWAAAGRWTLTNSRVRASAGAGIGGDDGRGVRLFTSQN